MSSSALVAALVALGVALGVGATGVALGVAPGSRMPGCDNGKVLCCFYLYQGNQ